jgi:hypothetical protein
MVAASKTHVHPVISDKCHISKIKLNRVEPLINKHHMQSKEPPLDKKIKLSLKGKSKKKI